MNPIDYIISYCNSISNYFYSIYLEVVGWVYPFWYVSYFFYNISTVFANIAWELYYFSLWVEDVKAKIVNILSWSTIQSYITSWFYYLYNLSSIFYYFATNVTNVITSWWNSISSDVLSWIADAKSYALAQVNSLRDTVLTWINDVYSWTTTQVNNAKTAVLAAVSDLEKWAITEYNNVRDWVLVIWSDIEAWTITQINNARDALLTLISSLETWTLTQINNIQAALKAILPWDTILAQLIEWGMIPGLLIQSLIDSTLQSWFPFYDDLVNLWNGIVDFFTDPEDWLYKAVDRIIERFW